MTAAALPSDRAAGQRRWCVVALLGTAFALLCGGAWYAAVIPALLSNDEGLHLDYAWQVGHGQLPTFATGPVAPLPVALPDVQWVAQHPPLYYVILAPAVTPLLDNGSWLLATGAGRLITLVPALLCIPALAWAARTCAGGDERRRRLLAVGTAAIGTSFAPFVGVAGAVYSDVAVVLIATLTLGVSGLVLRRGLTPGRVTVLAVLCSAGMLSRGLFGATLLLAGVAVMAAAMLHGRGRAWRRVLGGAAAAAVVIAASAIAAGWFYARNMRLTGTWTGSQPEWAADNLGRQSSGIIDVFTNPELGQLYLTGLFGPANLSTQFDMYAALRALVAVLLILAAALSVVQRRPWRAAAQASTAVVVLLVAQVAAVVALQVLFASTGGGLNMRYALPALLPIAMALAAGALVVPRGLGVAAAAAVAWVFVGVQAIWFLADRLDLADPSVWNLVVDGAARNNVPAWLVVALPLGTCAGVLLIGIGLWHATSPTLHQRYGHSTAADLPLDGVPDMPVGAADPSGTGAGAR